MKKKELNKFVEDVLNTLEEWCTIGEDEYYAGRSSMIIEIISGLGRVFSDNEFDYIYEKALQEYE